MSSRSEVLLQSETIRDASVLWEYLSSFREESGFGRSWSAALMTSESGIME